MVVRLTEGTVESMDGQIRNQKKQGGGCEWPFRKKYFLVLGSAWKLKLVGMVHNKCNVTCAWSSCNKLLEFVAGFLWQTKEQRLVAM